MHGFHMPIGYNKDTAENFAISGDSDLPLFFQNGALKFWLIGEEHIKMDRSLSPSYDGAYEVGHGCPHLPFAHTFAKYTLFLYIAL